MWNKRTKDAVKRFVAQPSHALLIVGPLGAGKGQIAHYIATEVLQQQDLTNHPYFRRIEPIKNSISISEIRSIQEFVKLKTISKQEINRIIVVENAQCLTLEAQNAFLKLLEEPPAGTLIILTASDPQGLLPTIISRTQVINIQSPAKKELAIHFATLGYKETEIERAYYISDGQPGLMAQLLENKEDNNLLEHIDSAKALLSQTAFQRLVTADQLIKQKTDITQLLWAMQRVSNAALQQAAQKGVQKQVIYWQKYVSKILEAQEALKANPQSKLLLTDLLI